VALPPIGLRSLHGENEAVVEQVKRLDIGVVDGQRHDNEIEIAGHQFVHEICRHGLAELEAEPGKASLQLRQRRRQEVGRDRRDGAELQHACQHPFLMLGVVEEVAHRCENGAGALRDLLALFGEFDARFAPFDQAHLELVLELLDLHAHGRLADGASLGSMAEMAGFRQRVEVTELSKRDHDDKVSLSAT
jgi:hypothetical protein